jgi:quinol-cytochrome oxidoreductase complex cytochrome b subunit
MTEQLPTPRERPPRRRSRHWQKRQSIFYAIHPASIPAGSVRLTYTFGLGGISVLATLIAVITGVLLTFYYAPAPDQAYASVTLIEDVVAYGSLVRALHYWSAQLLVIAASLHLARIVFTGSLWAAAAGQLADWARAARPGAAVVV